MPSPIKLKQKPTTVADVLSLVAGLVGIVVPVAVSSKLRESALNANDYALLGVALLGLGTFIWSLKSDLRDRKRRKLRILSLTPFPARVADIKSSWGSEGEPTFELLLRRSDGSGVGGRDRWHDVDPPPHWAPHLTHEATLLVRWDDDLEHAFVDWDASEEYRGHAGYREGATS